MLLSGTYLSHAHRLLPVHTPARSPRGPELCLGRFSRIGALAEIARRHRPALASAPRLDPVLAHRLHPNREAVGVGRVGPLRQASERGEDEAPDRVVRIAVD